MHSLLSHTAVSAALCADALQSHSYIPSWWHVGLGITQGAMVDVSARHRHALTALVQAIENVKRMIFPILAIHPWQIQPNGNTQVKFESIMSPLMCSLAPKGSSSLCYRNWKLWTLALMNLYTGSYILQSWAIYSPQCSCCWKFGNSTCFYINRWHT